jgi:enediyne biosynthesis protein E4
VIYLNTKTQRTQRRPQSRRGVTNEERSFPTFSSWFPLVSIVSLCSIAFTLCLACAGCRSGARGRAAGPVATGGGVQFVDVSEAAGIHFTHTSGASGRLYFPETVGSGCAFLDYDGDGHLDLFLVNSGPLPGFQGTGPYVPALYRGDGHGHFTDVTQAAGLAVSCYGIGCAVGDYDNDGHPDLYLTALGPNHLFHNNGNGAFTDVTAEAGVGDPRFSTSAAWFDYDRDGRLDLFVANYCRWTPLTNKICSDSTGHKHMCGPTTYQGVPNTLYRNNGDGTFTDVTRQAGVWAPRGKGLGILVWDPNDDGWPDLLIANDQEPNLLYQNNRKGTFTERGVDAGVAYSVTGKARAGMGIDSTDPLNDGKEAVVIGNLDRQGLAFFQDTGAGLFADVAGPAGLYEPSLPFVTFATVFCDYDLDGRKDLLIANGHVDENAAAMGEGGSFAQRLLLFHNEGPGDGAPRFREVGEAAGPGLAPRRVFRGIAVGDFDGDGDPDFLVTANGGKPLLLRNDRDNQDHWLQIRLRGTKSNRDGLGSRVRATAGGVTQTAWVRSGSSFASSNDACAYFGLGSAAAVDRIEVRWPMGETESFGRAAANQALTLVEGQASGVATARRGS